MNLNAAIFFGLLIVATNAQADVVCIQKDNKIFCQNHTRYQVYSNMVFTAEDCTIIDRLQPWGTFGGFYIDKQSYYILKVEKSKEFQDREMPLWCELDILKQADRIDQIPLDK